MKGLTAGTYSLLVTDVRGCTRTVTVIITQPVIVSATLSLNLAGTLLTAIGAGGTPPYTYLWSTGSTANPISVTTGFYWVIVTDAKGCKTERIEITLKLSATATVNSFDANVYPNPTHDKIDVKFIAPENKQYRVTLTDYDGRLVFDKSGATAGGENKLEFDLADLARGIYFVRVMSNDQFKVLRVVLQ